MNSLRALTSLSSAAAAAKASTSPRLAAASAFVAARPSSSICTAKRSSAESPLHLLRKQQRNFTQSSSPRALGNPVNIPKWLEENGHLLKPPVNNYCVYDDGYTVMIVGGPNERSDYHINETPEWFYQYKGSMLLRVVDSGEFRDIDIHQGEMFYLPANVPHNPVRFADTVGIVIEQRRPESSMDRLRWYCQNCHEQVHEAAFHCTDLGTQIKTAVEAFKGDLKTRTCKNCGTVCDVVPPKRS